MSVEVTTLKSGISVVTDAMPHLETRLARRLGQFRQPRRTTR